LLGVHSAEVELTRLFEGSADGSLGDLVEYHAFEAGVVAADDLAQVPGDGLPLSIEIRRQVDSVRLPGQARELAYHLLLAGENLVVGAPALPGIDPHASHQRLLCLLLLVNCPLRRRKLARHRRSLGPRFRIDTPAGSAHGQIAHVPYTRLYDVVLAEILADRPGLGRRLHDDE